MTSWPERLRERNRLVEQANNVTGMLPDAVHDAEVNRLVDAAVVIEREILAGSPREPDVLAAQLRLGIHLWDEGAPIPAEVRSLVSAVADGIESCPFNYISLLERRSA